MIKVTLLVKNGGRTQIQAYMTLISKFILFSLHILLAICWLRTQGAPSTKAAQAQDPYLLRPQFKLEVILINQSLTSQTRSLSKRWQHELQACFKLCSTSVSQWLQNLGSRPKVVTAWSLPYKHTVTLSLHIMLSLGSYLRVLVHVFIQIFMENQLSHMPDPQPGAWSPALAFFFLLVGSLDIRFQ